MATSSEVITSVEKPRILIIGVGNAYRSDDAVGLVVAQRLRQKAPDYVKIIEHEGEVAALLEAWKDTDMVFLIDAVYSNADPGAVYRFDTQLDFIPSHFFRYSTHALNVADAIEISRVLNRLPTHLIVYGIEGKSFEAEVGLSPEIENVVEEVVECVLREIQHK